MDNINSTTLQAYLLCFIKCMQSTIPSEMAAQVFWSALTISQSHPLLFISSIEVMTAAINAIARAKTLAQGSLGHYLLAQRSASEASASAVLDLEESLCITFTRDNFSFSIAGLICKGLGQVDAMDATSGKRASTASPSRQLNYKVWNLTAIIAHSTAASFHCS